MLRSPRDTLLNERDSSSVHRPIPLLEVKDLVVTYQSGRNRVTAVNKISFSCNRGEVLGIVGESGCGKTSLARCIVGLIEPKGGQIVFDGQELTGYGLRRPHPLRKSVQMVFQNPQSSINPQHTVEQCLMRPLVLYELVVRKKRRDKVVELLESVQLGSEYMGRYPHELSGGELQRVAIARAFSSDPDLIVCDEPVSSLDVSIQAGVLNLLMELQQKNKVSFVFISHDLNVVRHVSNRITVMYNGRICEMGTPSELFVPPYHPYTEELLAAVPMVGVRKRKVIPTGNPSRYTTTTDTPCCQFSGRCPRYLGMICDKSVPPDKFTHSERHLYCHIPLKELESMEPVLEKVVE
jgi:peptide/nickel transport system ATP-binding protein